MDNHGHSWTENGYNLVTIWLQFGYNFDFFNKYTLQKLLTHKSPQMTQRYAHLWDEALKKVADLAGNIIEEAANSGNKTVS